MFSKRDLQVSIPDRRYFKDRRKCSHSLQLRICCVNIFLCIDGHLSDLFLKLAYTELFNLDAALHQQDCQDQNKIAIRRHRLTGILGR